MIAHLDEHPALQQQLRDSLIKQANRAATGTTPAVQNGVAS